MSVPALAHPELGVPVAVYEYQRASGDVAFVVARFEPKDFRPAHPTSSGRWAWNLHNAPALLYRLPDVERALRDGERVWIVDGEKDADALAETGVVATCCARAQGWTYELAEQIIGVRKVRIVADNDESGVGLRQALDVRSLLLETTGIASSEIEIVRAAEGKDAADHLAAGHGLDDFVPVDGELPETDQALPDVVFVTGVDFVATPEAEAEAIVVDASGSTALAANGLGLTYGDGGAGKTTLWLDIAMHFAAGDPWLGGLLVPTRPLSVGWVENEGPQEEFRLKIERKLAVWRERVPAERFLVLKTPWGALDLRLPEHRSGVAAAVRDLDLDLLVLGPLNDLGMEGGGTPDDVRAFHGHLKDVQTLAGRLVSLMVLHHENTAGRVSGAWTGRPDLLVHVTQQGNGHTRVLWQKAKWSSSLHRTTSRLRWLEHEGFESEAEEAARPERVWDEIASYVLAHGGTGWGPVRDAVSGEDGYLQRRRDAMLEEGVLVNAGTDKSFKLWHRDDPARPLDLSGADHRTTAARQDAPSGVEGSEVSCGGAGYVIPAPHSTADTPDDLGTVQELPASDS
jgi:hypothetical protein